MREFKKRQRKKWFWYQITFMEHDNCPKFHNHTVKITIRWLLQYVENSEEKLIAKGDKKEYYQELNIVPLHIIKKGGKTTFMKEKLLHGKFFGNSFAKFTKHRNGFRKGLWRRKQKDYYWQVRNKPYERTKLRKILTGRIFQKSQNECTERLINYLFDLRILRIIQKRINITKMKWSSYARSYAGSFNINHTPENVTENETVKL